MFIMFQLVRNRHSGNILKLLLHTAQLVRKQGYTISNSTARVLPDIIEIEDDQTANASTNDDNLINQQHSESDNTATSSSDEWKFLFETEVEEEEDNYQKQERPMYNKRKVNYPHKKDVNTFSKIFRTLLDRKDHEHLKDPKSSKSRQRLLTIEKHLIDLMQRGGEKRQRELKQENENKWIKEHFDSIPNEPTIVTTSSLPNILSENVESEEESIELKDGLLKCKTKKQLQEFISKNIFGIEIDDNKNFTELKGAVDDLNRPFPFRYAMLLKQTILICNEKFKDPYLALSIFEQTKRRGLLSYLLGCTTEVYNQILLIRWEFWKDLRGVESLLNEMIDNKIPFDKETSDIISSIELEVISYNNSERWDSFDMRAYDNILKLFENRRKKYKKEKNLSI